MKHNIPRESEMLLRIIRKESKERNPVVVKTASKCKMQTDFS